MSKKVFKEAKIILGGVDVSDYVTRWMVGAEIGELFEAEIDILNTPRIIEIAPGDNWAKAPSGRDGRAQKFNFIPGARVPRNDKILVGGSDISDHVSRYDLIARFNLADVIRLYVQCDKDTLTINGTCPWETRS